MKLNVRWRRVFVATVVLCGLGLATLAVRAVFDWMHDQEEQRAAELHPHPANDMEQSEILRAVFKDDHWLEFLYDVREPNNPLYLILLDTSVTFCGKAEQEAPKSSPIADHDRGRWRTCVTLQDWEKFYIQDEGIGERLLLELAAANQVPSILPDPHSAKILYRPQATTARLFDSLGWDQFRALFPHCGGATKVSRAVLSQDGKHALIYVQTLIMYFPQSNPSALYYLVRTRDGWRVEKTSRPPST